MSCLICVFYCIHYTSLHFKLCVLDFSSPDIQRDRHHGVENNNVGPEGEEGREEEVVHRRVPGQIALKQEAHLPLPHCVTHSQDHSHTHQEAKDLTETHRWRNCTYGSKSDVLHFDLWTVEPKLGWLREDI